MAEEIVVRLAEDQFERLLEAIRMADAFYIPKLPPRPAGQERPVRAAPPVVSIPRWASGQVY